MSDLHIYCNYILSLSLTFCQILRIFGACKEAKAVRLRSYLKPSADVMSYYNRRPEDVREVIDLEKFTVFAKYDPPKLFGLF
jgi:hypothetical protein